MELRMPKKGEIYKHFKGQLYRVLTIAMHTETEEMLVVYQEQDGESVYARPLGMFVSKVNKEKYPNVSQKYRFELVNDTFRVETEIENSMIMDFLDIRAVGEKIRYLENVRNCITEEFLDVVAQSLDFVEKEGTLSERYQELLRYLQTVAKYERMR